MEASEMFVDLIRTLIREELSSQDSTEMCIIQNYDAITDRYGVSVLPDRRTVIPNIINASKYHFNSGDIGVLYKMGGRLSNSFLIAKVNPSLDEN